MRRESARQHDGQPEDPPAVLRHHAQVEPNDDAVHDDAKLQEVRDDQLPPLEGGGTDHASALVPARAAREARARREESVRGGNGGTARQPRGERVGHAVHAPSGGGRASRGSARRRPARARAASAAPRRRPRASGARARARGRPRRPTAAACRPCGEVQGSPVILSIHSCWCIA